MIRVPRGDKCSNVSLSKVVASSIHAELAAGIADLPDQLTMAAGALFTLKQRSANERESIAKLITIFAT